MHYKKLLSLGLALCLICICALAACSTSPRESADSSEKDTVSHAPVATFSWTKDSDCSLCHTTEQSSATDSACQIAANHAAVTCIECHSDAPSLEKAHSKVTLEDTEGAKKLKATVVSKEACLICHEDYSSDITAGSKVLTDIEGTTVNPHALPDTEQHATILCSNCHQMHSREPVLKTAPEACISCHHENVYECNTCH